MIVREILKSCDLNKLCDIIIQRMDYKKIISSYKRDNDVSGLSKKDIRKFAINKRKEAIKSCVSEMIGMEYTYDQDRCVGVTKYIDNIEGTDEEYFDVFLFSYREFNESGIENINEVSDISEIDMLPITTYSFIYSDWKDILGCRVIDASIQMYGIERVAAEIFWEMTWCGLDYETCKRNQNKDLDYLDKVEDDFETTYSIDDIEDEELEDILRSANDVSTFQNANDVSEFKPTNDKSKILFSEDEAKNIILNRNEVLRFWKAVRKYENKHTEQP